LFEAVHQYDAGCATARTAYMIPVRKLPSAYRSQ
jgi:hypothetical protein